MVYRFDLQVHRLESWSLGSAQSTGLATGIDSGLAVQVNGTVWVGANMELARLDSRSGAVQIYHVAEAAPSSSLPSPPRNPDIVGLAVDGSGDVAIAVSGWSEVPILHPQTQSYSYIGIGPGVKVTDVAYLSTGSLAVAAIPWVGDISGGKVLLVGPDGLQHLVGDVPGAFVLPSPGRFLAGGAQNYWIYPDGRRAAAPSDTTGSGWLPYPSSHPVWPLADGRVVSLARGGEGLVVYLPGSKENAISLPRRPCPSPDSGGAIPGRLAGSDPPTQPTSTTTRICHVRVAAMGASGDSAWLLEPETGLLWVVSPL